MTKQPLSSRRNLGRSPKRRHGNEGPATAAIFAGCALPQPTAAMAGALSRSIQGGKIISNHVTASNVTTGISGGIGQLDQSKTSFESASCQRILSPLLHHHHIDAMRGPEPGSGPTVLRWKQHGR